MEEKAALRKRLLAERLALRPEQVAESSAEVERRLLGLEAYQAAKNLVLYASRGNEVDTRGLMRRALAGGKKVALPSVDEVVRAMIMYQVAELERLRPGYKGILEPERREIAQGVPDLVVVPGVAFDARGARVGHGGGFYDRYLASLKGRGTYVALAYDFQVVERVPAEPHDVRVHVVVTPTRVIECREK